ncbi:MAG: YciI family protein [Duganella sp.]
MEFMVLRRANQSTERGDQPPALEPGVFLRPSDSAVRLTRRDGQWQQSIGPYSHKELVAGFMLVEASSRRDVIEQVRWWPLFDAGAVYEIRDLSGPATGSYSSFDERGTLSGVLPQRDPQLTRYVIFLRADNASEINLTHTPEAIERIDRHHEAGVRAGVVLSACALLGSATATRVHFANAKTTLVEGPFGEPRELVAGYVIVQAASLEDALAWAKAYPYLQSGELTVEIREACERLEHREFTPEMRAAEERLRAEMLADTLREALAKRSRS